MATRYKLIHSGKKLSDLSATTSAELAGVISDETGTGLLVFGTAPTFASTITVGTAAGTTGAALLKGTTSGTVTLSVADAAGTWTMKLPTSAGTADYVLKTDGSGNTSWSALPAGARTWTEVTGTSQTAVVNSGYIANNAALVTITIPSTAAVGDIIRVQGKGAGLWKLAQNASQTIHLGNVDSTAGVGGSVTATNRYDAIELLCITANNEWATLSSTGSFTVV